MSNNEIKSEIDDYEKWEKDKEYQKDSIVRFPLQAEFLWKSKWITSDKPGDSKNGAGSDAWERLRYPLWNASTTYREREKVRHNGKIWIAKWTIMGEEPKGSGGPGLPWDPIEE
ncbi:hypothetical protein [Arsenophonus sp.]|uniref:hypothetical protein n=1 Tax=Arsenophonus sp. TaxID=1872640 RepID=UPI0038792DC8